jgi:nucleotide-binding universal stress UspA family protein
MPMNILLAADGSEYTKRAARYLADYVADLAKKPKVHVLHVHGALPYGRAASVVGKKAIEKYQSEECDKALAIARKELDKAGVKYEAHWVIGEVAEQVKAFAKENDIDLIVMGSHGHGAFTSFAIGSTGARILAACKVPVLIVR